MIRNKDKRVYDKAFRAFSSSDFFEERKGKDKKSEKKQTYSQIVAKQLLEDGADAIAREEEEMDEDQATGGIRFTADKATVAKNK